MRSLSAPFHFLPPDSLPSWQMGANSLGVLCGVARHVRKPTSLHASDLAREDACGCTYDSLITTHAERIRE